MKNITILESLEANKENRCKETPEAISKGLKALFR